MVHSVVELTGVFLVGLLAGEELAINLGVRVPLARLQQVAHISARQELIRRLRVMVLILFAVTLAFQIAAIFQAAPWGVPFHLGSVGLLAAFITVTLVGTVPINKAALGWDPYRPPSDWQRLIRRWEMLDHVRTALAIGSFALSLVALQAG